MKLSLDELKKLPPQELQALFDCLDALFVIGEYVFFFKDTDDPNAPYDEACKGMSAVLMLKVVNGKVVRVVAETQEAALALKDLKFHTELCDTWRFWGPLEEMGIVDVVEFGDDEVVKCGVIDTDGTDNRTIIVNSKGEVTIRATAQDHPVRLTVTWLPAEEDDSAEGDPLHPEGCTCATCVGSGAEAAEPPAAVEPSSAYPVDPEPGDGATEGDPKSNTEPSAGC